MNEESRKNLMLALPALMLAVEMAKLQEPDGKAGLSVIITKPDGSGRLTATFECEQFFDDIIKVLGFDSVDDMVKATEKEDT